jgi:4a-hydroxytetrahydrobiopterin dehydratase
MRPRRRAAARPDYLSDALTLLPDWAREGTEIRRTLRVDDAQHAALTERIKVVADALQVWPAVRRLDGYTQILLRVPDGAGLTAAMVTLAARIEDAYRSVTA